ncbi:MAG: hypothetical protein QNJ63_09645 [Calothrix sp. MO_192.B10]|nr:hypothetical protein [Calothrix sp. MO_192.B10]
MAKTIDEEQLLLVEGRDEVNFFDALLKHIKIQDIQVIEVGGKDKFKNEFPALLYASDFSKVKSYAIVRDADTNAGATLASIQKLLKDYNQPVPNQHGAVEDTGNLKVGIFIMPGNAEEGMLEDLCLETIQNHPVLNCTEKYLSCLETNLDILENGELKQAGKHYFPKNRAKARMHSFLAGMYEYVPRAGLAAKKGYFDLDADILSDLKQFLLRLF